MNSRLTTALLLASLALGALTLALVIRLSSRLDALEARAQESPQVLRLTLPSYVPGNDERAKARPVEHLPDNLPPGMVPTAAAPKR